jgi:hypothetical protein
MPAQVDATAGQPAGGGVAGFVHDQQRRRQRLVGAPDAFEGLLDQVPQQAAEDGREAGLFVLGRTEVESVGA